MATPMAPKSLGTVGKKLWRDTLADFELRADEREILKAACAEADLIGKLETALDGQPMIVTGSMGQEVAHPLLAEMRQHRTTMAGLLRGLKLPDSNAAAGDTNQQRDAANSRWATAYGK